MIEESLKHRVVVSTDSDFPSAPFEWNVLDAHSEAELRCSASPPWLGPPLGLPTSYADPGGGAITDPDAGSVPEAKVLGCSFRTGL